jgi:hypothetical protein
MPTLLPGPQPLSFNGAYTVIPPQSIGAASVLAIASGILFSEVSHSKRLISSSLGNYLKDEVGWTAMVVRIAAIGTGAIGVFGSELETTSEGGGLH